MTDEELAAIRARWANATDGATYRVDLPVDVLAGAFAGAPSDIAALLGEVARLRAQRTEAEQVLAAVDAWAVARRRYAAATSTTPWAVPHEEVRRLAEAQHRGYRAVVALGDARRACADEEDR